MTLRQRRNCSPSTEVPQPASSRATAMATMRAWRILRSLEIFQVGRRLALSGGHQIAVGAQEIVLLADDQLVVALGAISLGPARTRILAAPKGLVHAPRPGQGMIEHGDLVMQNVRIGLIEMEPLFEG